MDWQDACSCQFQHWGGALHVLLHPCNATQAILDIGSDLGSIDGLARRVLLSVPALGRCSACATTVLRLLSGRGENRARPRPATSSFSCSSARATGAAAS